METETMAIQHKSLDDHLKAVQGSRHLPAAELDLSPDL
jgi:hypothetical protein